MCTVHTTDVRAVVTYPWSVEVVLGRSAADLMRALREPRFNDGDRACQGSPVTG